MFAVTPTRDEFTRLASQGNTIPVCRDILADCETPVSAFLRLRHRPNAFLLESVEGGERLARYSFLGSDPYLTLTSKGRTVTVTDSDGPRAIELEPGQDPLHVLETILAKIRFVAPKNVPLPRFAGGAVGYIGYDWVRFLEPVGERAVDDLNVNDVHLLFTDTLCIFDHVKHRITVLANAKVGDGIDTDAAYGDAVARVEALVKTLKSPPPARTSHASPTAQQNDASWESNLTREQYRQMIATGKAYIAAGDIIQTVLAQRFSRPLKTDPFDVYRALRSLNPSPYMFFLDLNTGAPGENVTLAGASPEILCTIDNRNVTVRPIAGTRKRGTDPDDDKRLEIELLADEKERAEHIMLVDLGRNDIGRIAEYGSVRVTDLMIVEKYSHVMHIVSNVVGTLKPDKTPMDVLRATFPAGTLSGAPKVRAMQIIEELEPTRRGVYGGAIGYFSYSGNVDACITIRTLLVKEGMAHVQAGGGIVADSDADAEFDETVNKSAAVRRAVEMAEAGLDDAPLVMDAALEANAAAARFSRLETNEILRKVGQK